MDVERKDGGPVFPELTKAGEYAVSTGGMSLRDYFAGQALVGLLASWSLTDDIRFVRLSYAERMKMFAFNSYLQADAMLAERRV